MLKCAYKSLAVWVLIFVLTIIRYNPSAYNIDLRNAQVFRDPMPGKRGSYFGFSVALYMDFERYSEKSLLLVGAPRANSSQLQSVTEPGTVFQCELDGSRCTEWPIHKARNRPRSHERLSQIKDNAWIGATIAIQHKREAKVIVCGLPWVSNTNGNELIWYMNGICYTTLAINATAFEREADNRTFLLQILPNPRNQITLQNDIASYYKREQVGFSLHINSRYAVDSSIAIDSSDVDDWKDHVMLTTQVTGPFLHTIIPSLAEEVYSYFGYAITAGIYFDKQDVWYASSAPRGAHMYGLIIVFNFLPKTNQNMLIKTTVYGQQYGEYFGAALTSCDVNNDRRDELIVGAPQWSRDTDEGRVYIFTARYSGSWNFAKPQTIEGEIVGGRFGSTVMCLGDIDHDGYGDIAVGAPYEEESGGAVYIFNGNRDSIFQKYSQRLIGSQFSSKIRGFGISISEPRDKHYYNPIAVGAYQSGEVVLLEPMIVVTINVTLVSKKLVKLKDTSFEIDIKLSIEGCPCLRGKMTIKLDQTYGRAWFKKYNRMLHEGYTDKLIESYATLGSSSTITHTIYLERNIQNMTSPLKISASLLHLDYCCIFPCVINMHRSKTEDIIKVSFVNFENNTPISDLNVTLSTDSSPDNTYVIGSTSIIMLHIDIYNRGEPAYQTKVRIFIEVLTLASILPDCIEDSRIDSTLNVICDVGDLPSETKKRLTLQLDMSMVRNDVKNIKLQALISTQSNETNLNDNTDVIIVYFENIVFTLRKITGKARESLYSYLYEKRMANSLTFQHIYEVQNFGGNPFEEAVFTVNIPTHISRPDTGRIAIVNIKNVTGKMDEYELDCESHHAPALKKMSYRTIMKNSSSIANDNTHVEFSPSIKISSENRIFYINCTSNAVYCTQFDCELRPFLNSSSVAKFLVTLDLQRSNFPDGVMEDKDIIFYVTEARLDITPSYAAQRDDHKLNALVATTFLGPLVAERISVWLIAFSIFLGLVLLTLLILCLKNFGFFDRPDLGLLKIESDLCLKIVD